MIPQVQSSQQTNQRKNVDPTVTILKVRGALIELFTSCKKEEKSKLRELAVKHKVCKGLFPTYLVEMGVIEKVSTGLYKWIEPVESANPSYFINLAKKAVEYSNRRIGGDLSDLKNSCKLIQLNPINQTHVKLENYANHDSGIGIEDVAPFTFKVEASNEDEERKKILKTIDERETDSAIEIDLKLKKSEARLLLILLGENKNVFLNKFAEEMSERLFNDLY